MTTHTITEPVEAAVLDDIEATREALAVDRVFGTPQTIDGITIIPVARIAGSAGGGGGAGTDTDNREGHGFGTLFGLAARPVGVYELRDGELSWKPVIDVDRLLRGAQVLAGIAIICSTLITLRTPSSSTG
jgi:uncharacterized spore protein YtfJ